MIKLYLILYTLITSVAYTALVAYFASAGVALGYVAATLIAATGIIAAGREKIAGIDHEKSLSKKDAEIERLKNDLAQKAKMLHSVKAEVIHVAITIDEGDVVERMRSLASELNKNPAINNIDLGDDSDTEEYLDLMSVKSHGKKGSIFAKR